MMELLLSVTPAFRVVKLYLMLSTSLLRVFNSFVSRASEVVSDDVGIGELWIWDIWSVVTWLTKEVGGESG